MKYLSLFSGIGGFEVAIHRLFPDAECLGFSEIKKSAIKVYKHHFPSHVNLGDITEITEEKLEEIAEKGCDLLVAGFPCTNLSSLASINGDNRGLEGPKSGLFYNMLYVIEIVQPKYILIENNFSMKKSNRELITSSLQNLFTDKIHMTMINAADFGVQTRKRLYWTNFSLSNKTRVCSQTWEDVLEDNVDSVYFLSDRGIENMNRHVKSKYVVKELIEYKDDSFHITTNSHYFRTRWQISMHSDTSHCPPYTYPVGKSRPFLTGAGGGTASNLVIIYKPYPIPRTLTSLEGERLFWLPDDYTASLSRSARKDVLGNCVVTKVIEYILDELPV